jgi:hypothetical protein
VEVYKRALAGLPAKALDPDFIDVLVPAVSMAGEFGVGRRTIGRRIAEAEWAGFDAAMSEQPATSGEAA